MIMINSGLIGRYEGFVSETRVRQYLEERHYMDQSSRYETFDEYRDRRLRSLLPRESDDYLPGHRYNPIVVNTESEESGPMTLGSTITSDTSPTPIPMTVTTDSEECNGGEEKKCLVAKRVNSTKDTSEIKECMKYCLDGMANVNVIRNPNVLNTTTFGDQSNQ